MATAQQVTLTPDQMRKAAILATQQGANADALRITAALLQRDPTDFAALLIRARAARALGQLDLAETSSQAAWRAAKGQEQRFQAALIRAQVLSTQGKRTRAQLWLRRAVQNAPSPQARAVAIRDFQYLRNVNPLRFDFDLQIARSGNINNGSSEETYELYGLPFQLSGAARALSGTELRSQARVTFGVENGQPGRTYSLRAEARDYWLSSEAKSIAPDADRSDFAYRQVTLSHSRAWVADPGRLNTLSFDLGRSWYGGALLSDIAGARFAATDRQTRGLRTQWGVSLRQQWRRDTPALSTTRLGFDISRSKLLSSGARLGLRGLVQQTWSDTATAHSTALSLGVSYGLANPLLGARATSFLQLGASEYGRAPGAASARRDKRAAAGLTLVFDQQAIYGFAPTATLSAARTSSNDARYSTQDIRLSFGLRSAF